MKGFLATLLLLMFAGVASAEDAAPPPAQPTPVVITEPEPAPPPAHQGFIHQNEFGLSAGIKQLWEPNSLDNLGNQVPKTLAWLRTDYVLNRDYAGEPRLFLTGELSRTIITDKGIKWPISLGIGYAFLTPH
jgi:hypothetical protein